MELSKLEELLGIKEERRGRALEIGIFTLWILMFVFQGLSLQVYYGVSEYAQLYYMRRVLSAQNQIFTLNIISNVMWFIVTFYILYSALFVERRDKYNIASGLLFFASGVAELVLAFTLWRYIKEIDYINMHMPVLDFDYIQEGLQRIQLDLNVYATVSSTIIYLCIGLAFIFIGLSLREFADRLTSGVQVMMWQSYRVPPRPGVASHPTGFERVSPGELATFDIARDIATGAKSLRTGGNMYLTCGVLDLLSIVVPGLVTFAFIFFILGALNAGRGRKIIENVRKRLMALKTGVV